MKQVRERLYIGDIQDAIVVLASSETDITHVLNLIPPAQKLSHGRKVAPYPVHDPRVEASSSGSDAPETLSANGSAPGIVRMNVPLRDVDTQNLLDNLEVCLEFIETGLASGAVLVHCFAGVSRSAAVVIAYLMKSERLKLEDAHKSLKEVSSGICPNLGFWQQLNMFQEMSFVIDRQSPTYKKFRLENLGEAHARGARLEPSSCAPDPGASAGELPNGELQDANSTTLRDDPNGSETKPFTVYRCKKCRRLVASKSNVIVHESGSGVFYLNLRKRVKKPGDDISMPLCSSIFVEPIQWMNPVFEDGAASGKLNCATCQAKLGNFNWAGMQCSCGAWVNPAFQLHKSSMDASWL